LTRGGEPETQAFQDFFATVMVDQNGDNGDDEIPPAAPDNATGTFLSLHSYQDEILWPWGFQSQPAPNGAQLQTIARKLAYYNGFAPTQTLYTVDGDTYDWTYGKFGVASFLFEVGPTSGNCGDFFPAYGCIDGIDGMPRDFWAEQRPAFIFLHKIASTPYMTAYGPDTSDVAAVPGGISPGEPVELTATIADHRYSGDPRQPIGAAEYFLDAPGADGTGTPLAAADGSWGGMAESVVALVDTSSLGSGQHYILVHGQNTSGDWGPLTAAFLYVLEPGVSPVIQGMVRDAGTNAPVAATVHAGTFQADTDPVTGFYSMMVVAGTYDITAEADAYVTQTVHDVLAQDYQTVQQDFYLYQFCDVFSDDVETGNLGWTAESPWAITEEASHSATHSWTDSPGGNYGNNVNVSLKSPVFDLTGTTGVTLGFWHIYDLQYYWDFGYVEYSTDGGATWVTAASYSNDDQLTWTQVTLPLPALDNQSNARIRFRVKTNAYVQQDGWHVDDVVLEGGGPACVVPMAPAPEFTSNSPVVFGEAAAFANRSMGTPPLEYLWDFGDDLGTSTEVNPTYTYSEPGTYDVTLTATNSEGSTSVTHPVAVVDPSCHVVASVELSQVTPAPLYPYQPVELAAEILPGDVGVPFHYTVDFGDGPPLTADSSQNPLLLTHAYPQRGSYDVRVWVWNCQMFEPDAVTGTVTVEIVGSKLFLPLVTLEQ
jgi:PKD repeat protein